MATSTFYKIPVACQNKMREMGLTCTQREIMDFIAAGQYDHRRDELPNVSITCIAVAIGRCRRHTARALSELKAMSLLLVVEFDMKRGDKLAWNENTLEWRSKNALGGDSRVTTLVTPESPNYGLQSHRTMDSRVTELVTLESPLLRREEDSRSEDANAYARRFSTYPNRAKFDEEAQTQGLNPIGLYLYQEIHASVDQAKAWQGPENPILWGCVFRLRALYQIILRRETTPHSVGATIRTILQSGILFEAYADKVNKLTANCECNGHLQHFRIQQQQERPPNWWMQYAERTRDDALDGS